LRIHNKTKYYKRVGHEKNLEDYPALKPETQIILNGKVLALNPFISQMIRGTITGMLSSLKGYRKGNIQIKIEDK